MVLRKHKSLPYKVGIAANSKIRMCNVADIPIRKPNLEVYDVIDGQLNNTTE